MPSSGRTRLLSVCRSPNTKRFLSPIFAPPGFFFFPNCELPPSTSGLPIQFLLVLRDGRAPLSTTKHRSCGGERVKSFFLLLSSSSALVDLPKISCERPISGDFASFLGATLLVILRFSSVLAFCVNNQGLSRSRFFCISFLRLKAPVESHVHLLFLFAFSLPAARAFSDRHAIGEENCFADFFPLLFRFPSSPFAKALRALSTPPNTTLSLLQPRRSLEPSSPFL